MIFLCWGHRCLSNVKMYYVYRPETYAVCTWNKFNFLKLQECMIKVAATAFSIICPQEIKSYLHCLSRFIIIYSLIIPSHLLPRDGLSLGSVQCQFQAPTYYAVTCSWPFISRALVLLGLFGRGERTDGNGNQCWGNKPLGVDTISSHRPEKWFAKYTQSFQANAVQINKGE